MAYYPKDLQELEAENAALREKVDSLQQSVGSLQTAIVAKDAEIHRLTNPRPQPRRLDSSAKDKFARPFR